jgi:FMN phosphatase YigB (HAD superfamily)
LSVRAVVFDVGETLVDETTEYGTWADWLGIPRHTFSAMFGAVIARGEDYRQTFQHFRPGFDLAVERLRREQASFPERFDEHDLYPDARPCLEKLKQLGFLVGIAGNQTARGRRRCSANCTSPSTTSAPQKDGGPRSPRQSSSPGS